MLFERGSPTDSLSKEDLRTGLFAALEQIEADKPRKRVLLIPPDFTRFHSRCGELAELAYEFYGERIVDVMPALGTHSPITEEQRIKMFGSIPGSLFRVHDWRNDVVTIGKVPASLVRTASEGRVDEEWPAQLNRLVWEGEHDLILSLGQVVPHEVMGMANYNKNLFVGVGGAEAINFSHFIGAVYGIERMLGRTDNPLRKILDYASENFMDKKLPLVYVQTVVGRVGATPELAVRGLYISPLRDCFERAAALSLEVNFTMLDEPLHKVVVFLDPEEFHSTWLGNKAVYRTRMAIADGGELIVLAPGVNTFGEDERIDALIRRFGYGTTPETLAHLESSRDLTKNLSAAAHLMHASSEGRFRIVWCPGGLSREEVENAKFDFDDVTQMMKRYDPGKLVDGWNTLDDGERVFYISNPAVGLWAFRGRFHGAGASVSPCPAHDAPSANATRLVEEQAKESSLDVGVGGGPFEAEDIVCKRRKT